MTASGLSDGGEQQHRGLLAGLGCAGFVLLAVVLEAVAGQAANSPEPGWAAGLVPLTWPQPLCVLWWLLVGAAAAGHRYSFARAGIVPHRSLPPLVYAAPFVLFAAGVAAGASWATWH